MSLRAKIAKLERAVARKGPGCRRCWGNRQWRVGEACEHCGYVGLPPIEIVYYTPQRESSQRDWTSRHNDADGAWTPPG